MKKSCLSFLVMLTLTTLGYAQESVAPSDNTATEKALRKQLTDNESLAIKTEADIEVAQKEISSKLADLDAKIEQLNEKSSPLQAKIAEIDARLDSRDANKVKMASGLQVVSVISMGAGALTLYFAGEGSKSSASKSTQSQSAGLWAPGLALVGAGLLGFYALPAVADFFYEVGARSDKSKKEDLQRQVAEIDGKIQSVRSQRDEVSAPVRRIQDDLNSIKNKISDAQSELDSIETTRRVQAVQARVQAEQLKAQADKELGEKKVRDEKMAKILNSRKQVLAQLSEDINNKKEFTYPISLARQTDSDVVKKNLMSPIDWVALLQSSGDLIDWSMSLEKRATGPWVILTVEINSGEMTVEFLAEGNKNTIRRVTGQGQTLSNYQTDTMFLQLLEMWATFTK